MVSDLQFLGTVINILLLGFALSTFIKTLVEHKTMRFPSLMAAFSIVYVVFYLIEPAPPSYHAFFPDREDHYTIFDVVRMAALLGIYYLGSLEIRYARRPQ